MPLPAPAASRSAWVPTAEAAELAALAPRPGRRRGQPGRRGPLPRPGLRRPARQRGDDRLARVPRRGAGEAELRLLRPGPEAGEDDERAAVLRGGGEGLAQARAEEGGGLALGAVEGGGARRRRRPVVVGGGVERHGGMLLGSGAWPAGAAARGSVGPVGPHPQ